MAVIVPITSEISTAPKENRKEKAQNAAAAGGAAGCTVQTAKTIATRRAARKELAANTLRDTFTGVAKTAKTVKKNSKEVTGLLSQFFKNAKDFSDDMMKVFARVKRDKAVSALLKNPVLRGISGAFGYSMAFFVLVSGLTKAVDNGKITIGDLKDKLENKIAA